MTPPIRGSITEQIYLETRAQILFGIYAPGDVIVSKSLQDLYGCGLRLALDALNALCVEGYIEPQHRNFAVRLWRRSELDALFAIFTNLQSLALKRTLERASDAALLKLSADVEGVVGEGGLYRMLAAHLLLHDALIRLSGVGRSPELAARLVPPAFHRRLWATFVSRGEPARRWSCEPVARLLVARDFDASLPLLRAQILAPREAVLAAAEDAERRAAETFGLERYAKIAHFEPPHTDAAIGSRGKLLSCENLPWGVTPKDHPELLKYGPLVAA